MNHPFPTLAILDSNPAVLVRMETLRRATLYARQDPPSAKELLTRLRARATKAPEVARGALAPRGSAKSGLYEKV